jgi:hypothetical protein
MEVVRTNVQRLIGIDPPLHYLLVALLPRSLQHGPSPICRSTRRATAIISIPGAGFGKDAAKAPLTGVWCIRPNR